MWYRYNKSKKCVKIKQILSLFDLKECAMCKNIKKYDSFYKNKNREDKMSSYCSQCHKNRYINNKEKLKVQRKIYRENNKERIRKINNYYYINNKEKCMEATRKWCNDNRESHSIYQKEYNRDHKEDYNNYKKQRFKYDINFKLLHILRGRISGALKNDFKKTSSIQLLGCDIQFYKRYLEHHFEGDMAWENHGKLWQIDHIVPCYKFDMINEKQQRECFNYKNTRPILIEDHKIKTASDMKELSRCRT